jgi:23S rRNA (adenine2503-C2)-methyltransferase
MRSVKMINPFGRVVFLMLLSFTISVYRLPGGAVLAGIWAVILVKRMGGEENLVQLLDAKSEPAAHVAKRVLFGLTLQQLTDAVAELGQKPYRARQLAQALYRDWVGDLNEVTTWPKTLQNDAENRSFSVDLPQISQVFTSIDGTERYLISVSGGQTVETVWMPGGDGGVPDEDEEPTGRPPQIYRRATICVSSQIGCAVNCQFCLTAKLGIERNLTAGEIAGQVVAVLKRQGIKVGRDRINLVFMGMGEPFLNYDPFMDAVRLLVNEVHIPESRMTVSTSGILPGIERFGKEAIRPKLALSLNASNNEVRESIMPITRKWPIEQLLAAVKAMPRRPRDRVTFEYVLLGGVNDRIEHADEVIQLLRRANLPGYVNLIVWNPGPGIAYRQPEPEDVDRFQKRLIAGGVPTFIRRPRGRDIYAACGQLKKTAGSAA